MDDDSRKENPGGEGEGHNAEKMVRIQQTAWQSGWIEGSGRVFSLSATVPEGQPVCAKSVNTQGEENNEGAHVYMCIRQTRATLLKESLS